MKLFLIDGHALIFKMYYAFIGRPMINSKGVDTSILFGFTKYLLDLIEREKPTHIAVSFDPPGGTFRNKMYPEYKANRGETPELVVAALEPLTAIVKAMGMPVLMIPGFEADDVIGSAARKFAGEGMDVYMVTPDKDYGQLVNAHVLQYRPGKGGENEILGVKEICAKWGITGTEQVIDILALCGDSADNVPGVDGIGPVGAAKLLGKYGSVDGIYSHIEELTASQKAKFTAAEGHIGLSRELVTIKTDIELDVSVEDMALRLAATPELMELLDLYEMRSLARRLSPAGSLPAAGVAPDSEERSPHFLRDESLRRSKFLPGGKLPPQGGISNATAITLDGDTLYLTGKDSQMRKGDPAQFKDILEDENEPKAGFNLKAAAVRLQREWGITLRGRREDIELMHYLLDPERSHSLEAIASSYPGITLGAVAESQMEGTLFGDEAETQDGSSLDEAMRNRNEAILRLSGTLRAEMHSRSATETLYDTIEEPLSAVLSGMESTGVRIDPSALRAFADGLRSQMLQREKEVRELAGKPDLNVASPKQIGEVIFEKLRLDPKAKKPKNGSWPTDEQTLQELSDRSPIIEAILDYRGLRKLLSTYIDPIPGYISEADGRVHTTFNQALTSTGRLSSSNPNLQNIPIRSEQGREIRKAFTAPDGNTVIMSADYSQIELRVMAHLCGDEHLCEAFRAGQDVHAATAAKIYRKSVDEVSPDERRAAKTANFGIMYGISSFGLSQRLGCSRAEAKQLIDDYFTSFPSIRAFIDRTLADARENGYVETMLGRRRYIPDLLSPNGTIRSLAERNAVNAPIQGTAADIMKLAMIAIDRALKAEGLKSRMVLQIHDEVLLEVPENEIEQAKELLKREMEGVMKLDVPLTVECNYGKSWLEAH